VPLVRASGPAGVADAGGDPASHAEMADSLSLAFLVLHLAAPGQQPHTLAPALQAVGSHRRGPCRNDGAAAGAARASVA
jgi:hypothetical protein